MSIVSSSSTDTHYDQLDVTSNGVVQNDMIVYLKLSNGSVLFRGDNKQQIQSF